MHAATQTVIQNAIHITTTQLAKVGTEQSVYFLVDASQLKQKSERLTPAANCINLLSGLNVFEHLEETGPWLIQSDQMAQIKEHIAYWLSLSSSAVIWMTCRHGLVSLAEHWRRQLKVKFADGSERVLRFYDSRVLQAIQSVFTREQNCRLYGGVETIFYVDAGKIYKGTFKEDLNPHDGPYELTEQQQEQVAQLLLPYTVLGELAQMQPEMLRLHDPAEQLQGVRNMLAAAQSYGLKSLNDLVAFCSLCFDFDLTFYEHPNVKGQLDRLKTGASLEQVIGLIEPSVWDQLAQKKQARKAALGI